MNRRDLLSCSELLGVLGLLIPATLMGSGIYTSNTYMLGACNCIEGCNAPRLFVYSPGGKLIFSKSITNRVILMQLARAGIIDHWTLLEKLGIPDQNVEAVK